MSKTAVFVGTEGIKVHKIYIPSYIPSYIPLYIFIYAKVYLFIQRFKEK